MGYYPPVCLRRLHTVIPNRFEMVREGVSKVDYVSRAPSVLCQADRFGIGIELDKILKAALIGSAPSVDGLPRIAYDEYASISADELDQLLLGPVYILVFVHQKIPDVFECIWLFFQLVRRQAD